jgi:putative ABC transport system substrate-binding protein
MRRREFIAGAGIAMSWPFTARAQQTSPKMWRVGFLNPGSSNQVSNFNAWKRKLRDLRYLEGQNLIIDQRFAENDFTRLPQLARDLVTAHPDALVAVATPAVSALQKETSAIPIVMADIADPIGSGFVRSLARPGGKITGTANMTTDYIPKTIELLRELLPGARRVAALMSANPTHPVLYRAVETAATAAGVELFPAVAKAEADLDAVFAAIREKKCEALIVFTDVPRLRIISLAALAQLPAIYQQASFVVAGGLISYGADSVSLLEQTAVYVDKIFKGADPADLPVQQPTKFDLLINLKTAKALGLTVPPTMLARADEVIE